MQKIECFPHTDCLWERYVPSRLEGTRLARRKQVWYIRPVDWSNQSAYNSTHEEQVNKLALEGGVGVLIYDLSESIIPDQWASIVIPFAQMHQRLHLNGSYEKWLIQTFVVVPNDIVLTALNAVLTGMWKPTRPLSVVSSIEVVEKKMETLWRPRS